VTIISQVQYYYDLHPTPEDLMGDNAGHSWLVRYLLDVLDWQFRAERWFVVGNLNLYRTTDPHEPPITPDVALFKGVIVRPEERSRISSWWIHPPENPPPAVVFEVASAGTWKTDVQLEPERYAERGIREYFYSDPQTNEPEDSRRLRGWQMTGGEPGELRASEYGSIWSEELESWLAPAGSELHLYDRAGHRRLTEAEAADERAEREARRAESEQAAKEAERAAKEKAWERLRELGIDPETSL
jgi:Uma2 family endonuclease